MIGFVRRNLGLKLMSLVLAYASWAYIVGRSPGVRFVNVAVEVSPPEGMVIVDYGPREARVRLQGDAPSLNRLSEQNVYARVQLESGLRAGIHRIAVQDRDIQGVPQGVTREVVSQPLTVRLERRMTRLVPVRVRINGSAPEGYRVVQATAEPSTVEISGPEDAMRGADQVWTEPVDVSSRKRPFTAQPELVRPDALLVLRPETVRVSVLVDEVPRPLEMIIPVQSTDDQFQPDPDQVRIVMEGPPSLLPQLRGQVAAIADASGVSTRGGLVPVRVEFGSLAPDETARVRVAVIDPPRVRLRRAP